VLYKLLVAGLLAGLLSACGGDRNNDPASSTDPAPAPTTSCTGLAALPAQPASARSLASFGITPSDTRDNTAVIQAALDALKPGEWLLFPGGTYLHSKSLHVRVPGVVLWSEGATLVATNANDSAILLQADGASLYGFRLHAVTSARGSTMQHARIVIAPAGTGRVRNVTVRRNVIENGGAPGTSLANGASSAGILVYHADGFLVAENTVKRTLADAIHVTDGSINGRVILNNVRESGDDMIAVVSYMGSTGTPITTLLGDLAARRDDRLVRNILIADNDVSGQYWGRGISVVGGENVTIQNNSIANTTYGAGILLARDANYLTFGVHNVVVRNNTIEHVQTTAPAYSVGTLSSAPRTGQAGIEIHSIATVEETQQATFSAAIAVDKVNVEGNVVDDTLADGIRLGVGTGDVGLVGLVGNRLSNIRATGLNIKKSLDPQYNVYCARNTRDGNTTSSDACTGEEPVATGAALSCGG
jgi:hypothetical protein